VSSKFTASLAVTGADAVLDDCWLCSAIARNQRRGFRHKVPLQRYASKSTEQILPGLNRRDHKPADRAEVGQVDQNSCDQGVFKCPFAHFLCTTVRSRIRIISEKRNEIRPPLSFPRPAASPHPPHISFKADSGCQMIGSQRCHSNIEKACPDWMTL